MIAQLLAVLIGTLAAVTVVTKAPNGPRIEVPRRKCGHRQGAWVCVQRGCDGTHHYYRKAA